MEQMKLKNINKSNWKKYRFDEIAKNISERVDPNKTELTTYIGLEHIDSENIHITRSGTPDDVNGTKLRFYKGDVIFGRRRAYQRKAGIAECDGFCSAHALVLRANPEVIHPKLFPFFLHSDSFMDRAVNISVGSLSPTINWGTLKFEEFLLPPPEEQEKLAELLWAMDEVIERESEVLKLFNTLLLSSLKHSLSSIKKRIPLRDLCVESGKYGANSSAIEYDNSIRYIRITDIGEFGILNKDKVSAEHHEDKYLLSYGDLLLARSADPGRSYYYRPEDGKCTHAGYLIKFRLDLNIVLPEFVYYYTQTKEFKLWITQTTRTGTLSNINAEEFSNLDIPIMKIDEQKKIIQEISTLFKKLFLIKSKIKNSKKLRNSLVNQIF